MGLTSENYVDEAERVIKTLIEKDRSGRDVIRLTTSKIRGILSLVTELYNDIIHEPSINLEKSMWNVFSIYGYALLMKQAGINKLQNL